MTGIQDIPLRAPEEWSAKWFDSYVRDVLRFVDVRNAIGVGISIEGTSDEEATLISTALGEAYIVAEASDILTAERLLTPETDVLTVTDNGPDSTIVVGVKTNGLDFEKIQQIDTSSFIGRTTAATGDIETLTTTQATALLDLATTALKGVIILATNAEAVTGTDAAKAITAASLTARQEAPAHIGSTTPNEGTFTQVNMSGTSWLSGAGTPEAVVTAAIGSLFTRTDGGASTTLYVKESGAGNTGWIAK